MYNTTSTKLNEQVITNVPDNLVEKIQTSMINNTDKSIDIVYKIAKMNKEFGTEGGSTAVITFFTIIGILALLFILILRFINDQRKTEKKEKFIENTLLEQIKIISNNVIESIKRSSERYNFIVGLLFEIKANINAVKLYTLIDYKTFAPILAKDTINDLKEFINITIENNNLILNLDNIKMEIEEEINEKTRERVNFLISIKMPENLIENFKEKMNMFKVSVLQDILNNFEETTVKINENEKIRIEMKKNYMIKVENKIEFQDFLAEYNKTFSKEKIEYRNLRRNCKNTIRGPFNHLLEEVAKM